MNIKQHLKWLLPTNINTGKPKLTELSKASKLKRAYISNLYNERIVPSLSKYILLCQKYQPKTPIQMAAKAQINSSIKKIPELKSFTSLLILDPEIFNERDCSIRFEFKLEEMSILDEMKRRIFYIEVFAHITHKHKSILKIPITDIEAHYYLSKYLFSAAIKKGSLNIIFRELARNAKDNIVVKELLKRNLKKSVYEKYFNNKSPKEIKIEHLYKIIEIIINAHDDIFYFT